MINKYEITTYTIDDHPNPERVFDWIRNNWHDLGQFEVEEFVSCFKSLAKYLGTTFDYSVSIFPDQGEYLKLGDFDFNLLRDCNPSDLPITGICWDYDFIVALNEGNINNALNALHKQGEYIYSDEGLKEFCEANEFEFTANGEMW